jgi:hypothetical protein
MVDTERQAVALLAAVGTLIARTVMTQGANQFGRDDRWTTSTQYNGRWTVKLKNWIAPIGIVACLSACSYWTGKQFITRTLAAANVDVTPYTLDRVDFTVKNGAEVVVGRGTISRRRDGAIHTISTRYDPSTGTPTFTIRRIDFADGSVAMVVDSIRAKSTAQLPQDRIARIKAQLLNPPPGCQEVNETSDGQETLLGHSAIRVIRQKQSDSLVRFTEWRMPDFSCATIQGYMQERPNVNGPWATITGFRATSITEADPDPSLFTNWQGYEEMKPSDMKKEFSQSIGKTPETCPECFAGDTSDGNYLKWHQQ